MSTTHIFEDGKRTGDGMTEKVNRAVLIQRKAEKVKNEALHKMCGLADYVRS